MTKPLSLDLREGVVAAVDDGVSGRQAGERFGVGVASAIRWCQRARETGSPKAAPQGGDRRSERIEAEHDLILGIVDQSRDMTLIESQAEFAKRGHSFAVATLWRFFDRPGITWRKDRARGSAGSAGPPEAPAGLVRPPTRSRPRTSRLHRRSLDIDQYGARRGRCIRRERLRIGIPYEHWKTRPRLGVSLGCYDPTGHAMARKTGAAS